MNVRNATTMTTGILMIAAALSTGQSSCTPQLAPPLFDATGLYFGLWEGVAMEGGDTVGCDLTVMLEDDSRPGLFSDNRFMGTVDIDLSCITLPDDVTPPEGTTVDVTALVADDTVTVSTLPRCGAGTCVEVFFEGIGVDSDDDGFLNALSGEWEYWILEDREPVYHISGEFMVEESV